MSADGSTPVAQRRTFRPLQIIAKDHPCSRPMLIRDYLPAASIVTVFGEPGSGKTTVVTDMICSIDTGRPWRGKKTTLGVVWYIAAEDPYGVRLRMEAWYQAHDLDIADTRLELREDPLCFADPNEVSALIEEINSVPLDQRPSLIVLDTLADTGGNFDFNHDMGLFCRGFERLRQETGATLLVIHHCGHSAKDRPRNGSELGGKSDVILPVTCDMGITTLSCSKLKNGDRTKARPLSWSLKTVATDWADADGEIITSVVMEPTDDQPRERVATLTKPERIALDALGEALRKSGVEDDGIVTADEADWRQEAYDMGVSDAETQDARRKAFNRARQSLTRLGRVSHNNGRFWLPRTDRTDPHTDRTQTAHGPAQTLCAG